MERWKAKQISMLNHFGITKDVNMILHTLEVVNPFQYDGMYYNGRYTNFLIFFNMKVKIMMDNLFEDSFGYMSFARGSGPNGEPLLDICDIVNIYKPYRGAVIRDREADSL